jgi:hypothetical protein
MDVFQFDTAGIHVDPDTWLARIPPGIAVTKEGLLTALAERLEFPEYFGHNWDALAECLRDFSWLKEKRIVIVHEELPTLLGAEALRTYLDILSYCVRFWRDRQQRELLVIFPGESRQEIDELLSRQ